MTSVCQSNFHLNQQTAPHAHCIETTPMWEYTQSICSMSTTVRIYRQETAAEHWGIYWAIIPGGVANCGPMFTKHVMVSIWGLFYFCFIQYSSLRLNTNPPRWHDHPSKRSLNIRGATSWAKYYTAGSNPRIGWERSQRGLSGDWLSDGTMANEYQVCQLTAQVQSLRWWRHRHCLIRCLIRTSTSLKQLSSWNTFEGRFISAAVECFLKK